MKKSLIIGFGIACMDYIFIAPRAEPGGFAPILNYKVEGGGLTATALVAASRLGAQTVMLGRIGDDEIGDQIVQSLQTEGVDTSHLIRVKGAKSYFSIVHVDAETAERTIYGRREENIDCSTELIPLDILSGADVLVLDPHWIDGARTVAQKARELGIPIVLDSNLKPQLIDQIIEIVKMTDYPIISRNAAFRFADTNECSVAAHKIRALGPKTVIITCGSDGTYFSEEHKDGVVPAFPVETVDTTGAGDVFHGAFAFALTQKWSLKQAIIFASAVAAIKCTHIGGRSGIPTLEHTLQFLRKQGIYLPDRYQQ
ncbi:MAG: carbohydrate kinase family protein [Armatimonadota bacterium]